ncbi:MAG: glycosyltransferase family 2 protein [Schleiferiaceae bacterium]|nr:glycosyltransferase family 2 protein [Schleiferiaceae bacterium]
MRSKNPLVSFVVNCYNGEKFLEKCLHSILDQTYQNWELVFWDNASTDNSAAILNSFGDSRFKYFKSSFNVTLGQARAWAVEECNGQYIAFLDVDDEWFPKKTELQIDLITKENSYLCYSGVLLKTDDGNISTFTPKYKSGYIFDKLLNQFEINMPCAIIKSEALATLNINFDPEIIASEEYDLFIQIAAKYNVSVIKEPLCMYRVSTDSLTNSSIENRSQDKRITFNKLEESFSAEISRYRRNYRKAKAKIDYYEFQYSYSKGDYLNAKKDLRKIIFTDYRYFLIFMTLYICPEFYSKLLKWYDRRGIN